ncbi:PREDICTED: SID1 transmembrane family member 1-like [Atta cephalotes]|uniref:SID1 transmembrane family member 1 n=1 Tax=Atta cephalotes TaxID=12957 RepID=A0A158NHH5_ATTCE|nr:PREDICTED: SID1 transmembrane family member 1-like [Atta cephalotes]
MQNALKLFIVLSLLDTVRTISSSSFSPIVVEAKYEHSYNETINSTVEYVFLYPASNVSLETARITIESNATHSLPLIIVVRQTTGILSWQIPLLVNSADLDTVIYNKTSRTLCSTKYYRYAQNNDEHVIVGISTASHENITFSISVVEVMDFYLSSRKKVEVQISPSEPIYYGYIFSKEENSSVIVRVESDNDICMTVSVQNTSCPVFDLERNIEFSGHWQTVSRRGGITVPREAYPLGFFVVLVVKGEDTDCNGLSSSNPLRTKNVTLIVNPTITKRDYVVASVSAATIVLGFCIIYITAVIVFSIRESKKLATQDSINENQDFNEHIPSPSMVEENSPKQLNSTEEDSSLDEDDIDLMEDALSDKDVIRTKVILSVCDLARKEPRILRHKSRLYLYYLTTVAIFYTLPVVQLAVTYQRVLHTTGNQDMCYYNFLCAHPLGLLSDFNHLFSNFGYVMLGLLFIFLTYSREHNELDKEKIKCYGIPQHYGLFYAMGTALIMEGILSASYHVCPSRSNFQFDTSFMYVIAVLCMIKIYQNRHPDINARAPVTFGMLAVIIFAGLIGVLNGSKIFLIIFSILHLLICFFLTVQIYYMGRCKFDRGAFKRMVQRFKHEARCGIWHLLRPLYPARFIMLVLANLCNVGLAVFGNMYQQGNFATFLLAILMSNLILYTFFYIMMKLCHREKILPTPAIYIFLSMLFWGAALYFFVNKTISWALTPAQSRLYNKPCALLNFFDSHDIWHFLSALAMFFSFMVLLTLDDDLTDVHRSQIPVF